MSIYEYNEEEHMRMEREDAFEDGKKEGREEGLALGHKSGQEQTIKLISQMLSDGLADQLSRLAKEPAFFEEMLKKYNL